jgi:hypothetical protein
MSQELRGSTIATRDTPENHPSGRTDLGRTADPDLPVPV